MQSSYGVDTNGVFRGERHHPMGTDCGKDMEKATGLATDTPSDETRAVTVSLLTGGSDKPYVYGLTNALLAKGATLDLVGSDELDGPDLRGRPGVNFLNLRGDQRNEASSSVKALRIAKYYAKLIAYAAKAKPRIFHILWNNRFETFDRTLLMLYFKCLGKRIALTAHNVNQAARDRNDSFLNRLTLGIQYRLANRIFVHTAQMKNQLAEAFGVPEKQITVIPFGVNDAVPRTHLTQSEARKRLAIRDDEKVVLFFGRIKPYKGLEYLIAAFQEISKQGNEYRLMIVGSLDPVNGESYNNAIRDAIRDCPSNRQILLRTEFIPDEEIEIYFKAADVVALPYTHIYQSGVLVLGYSFGLPVLATDVGSLKEDIVEGQTGFVCRTQDPRDLTRAMERYFASDLFENLGERRAEIQNFARERHSWERVGEITMNAYAGLLGPFWKSQASKREDRSASLDAKASS
jgi:glycosyltransferase involved in cell wall biosynthesis